MASVTFDGVGKTYRDGTRAVSDLSLEVDDGEFVVLVGPSGCGKTTALRMVAGLEEITDGEIRIGERVVNWVEPQHRDIAMVFQNYALYPQMTVADNIAFGLKMRKVPRSERRKTVQEIARVLGLEEFLDAEARSSVGQAAPARRHGARDRAGAEGIPDGRAAVEPGRQAARADAGRDLPASSAKWRRRRSTSRTTRSRR